MVGAGRISRSASAAAAGWSLEQHRCADADGPVLVGECAAQRRRRGRGAVLSDRGQRRRTRRIRRVSLASLVRIGERLRPRRRLQRADAGCRRRAHHRIVDFETIEQDLQRLRRLHLHERREHGRNHALIRIGQQQLEAGQAGFERQRAEDGCQRGAHAPMRVRIEAGEHGDEVLRVGGGQRPQRRASNRRARVREHVEQRFSDPGRADVAECADGFEPHQRIGCRVADELQQRFCRRRVANRAQRAHRLDEDRAFAARNQRHQHRQRRSSLQPGQSLDRERASVGMLIARERQQRRQRTRVLEALERVGDRPPSDPRLCAAVEHGGG